MYENVDMLLLLLSSRVGPGSLMRYDAGVGSGLLQVE